MTGHSQAARELFERGYNCAQAVFAAYCDETGLDFETAVKLSSSFGGGMGKLREVCGAVSGIFMVAGLKYGYTSPDDDETKAEHYKLIQELAEAFKAEHGSIICRDLLELQEQTQTHIPEKRTREYYQDRPCADLVAGAARILDEVIGQRHP